MNSTERVILVNEFDEEIGEMEKMQAHREGALHRAFSVFVFNSDNHLLIHKRAHNKYHSSGLWTNTCCSHQRAGESNEAAAKRRLQEEMGLKCELSYAFSFVYKAELDNGLKEHEYDHVFLGVSDQIPNPDGTEVDEWKYVSLNHLRSDIERNPSNYTEWFKICIQKHLDKLMPD